MKKLARTLNTGKIEIIQEITSELGKQPAILLVVESINKALFDDDLSGISVVDNLIQTASDKLVLTDINLLNKLMRAYCRLNYLEQGDAGLITLLISILTGNFSLARNVLNEQETLKHYGPGPHPKTKTPQSVHSPKGGAKFLETLHSSEVASTKFLGGGVIGATVVTFENGETGMWKPLHDRKNTDHDGNSEVLAYRISDALGLDLVPATDYFTLENETSVGDTTFTRQRIGSIQEYVNGDVMAWYTSPEMNPGRRSEYLYNKHPESWNNMAILDYVLTNTDRHTSNIMIEKNTERILCIDHGHSKWRVSRSFPIDIFKTFGGMDALRDAYITLPKQAREITFNEWKDLFNEDSDVDWIKNSWDNLQYLKEYAEWSPWKSVFSPRGEPIPDERSTQTL